MGWFQSFGEAGVFFQVGVFTGLSYDCALWILLTGSARRFIVPPVTALPAIDLVTTFVTVCTICHCHCRYRHCIRLYVHRPFIGLERAQKMARLLRQSGGRYYWVTTSHFLVTRDCFDSTKFVISLLSLGYSPTSQIHTQVF
jgi:hypothetical protein